jgi:endo-1,4-beta-xylanase
MNIPIASKRFWSCVAVTLTLLGVNAAEPATLKAAYGNLFDLGAAIPGPELNPAEQELLRANFTVVTPENCMKPRQTEPAEGRFTFERADALVAFAQQNGLKVNGHTLLWHMSCPNWFFQEGEKPAGRDLVLKRMRNHISGLVTHFRGKMLSWDVVNEALSDKQGEYLRNTPWLKSIGEDFVREAFIAARKADPDVQLYYNDYRLEVPDKRAKALRLLRDLKQQQVPIDGIGIQGHWALDQVPFQDLEDAIVAFHAEGVKVMITELDLDMVPRAASGADIGQRESGSNDPYAKGCPPEMLKRQAEQYAKLFALFHKHADKIARVTFWGLHDGRSWLNGWPRKRTNYPLLWDRKLQPKPAFAAVLGVTSER